MMFTFNLSSVYIIKEKSGQKYTNYMFFKYFSSIVFFWCYINLQMFETSSVTNNNTVLLKFKLIFHAAYDMSTFKYICTPISCHLLFFCRN